MSFSFERAVDLTSNFTRESLERSLIKLLTKDDDASYSIGRLHYGSDLWPGACLKKTWLKVRGAKQQAPGLGEQVRFWGGRKMESLIGEALGNEVLAAQFVVRPRRASAARWEGHADFLLKSGIVVEVKAPRAATFAYADGAGLVKEQWRWQLSAYVNEARARGLADRGAFVVIDREGQNGLRWIPLEDVGEVAIEQIVEQEENKNPLVLPVHDHVTPPLLERDLAVKVWKGRSGVRRSEAISALNWQCSYCPFRGVSCEPGPEEQPATITKREREAAVQVAEQRWQRGVKASPLTVRRSEIDEFLNPFSPAGEAVSSCGAASPASPY